MAVEASVKIAVERDAMHRDYIICASIRISEYAIADLSAFEDVLLHAALRNLIDHRTLPLQRLRVLLDALSDSKENEADGHGEPVRAIDLEDRPT